MPRKLKQYAVYKGDDFLFIGTAKECSKSLRVSEAVIRYYTTPAYMRRLEKRVAENAIVVVNLGVDD